ncbi:MAG: Prepilin-type N-terminal cleavage/methylation protein [Gemmatimonadetes bacterium]|nr:Prepilin-type N-terminal cleavage/methylation protein [Gemmatimonadota bacterium]
MLVVVTIISVLSSIALPKLQDVVRHAKAAKVIGAMAAVRVGVFTYYSDLNAFPTESGSGVTPTGLTPYLPKNFKFATTDYNLDYDNLTLFTFTGGTWVQSQLIMISVRPNNNDTKLGLIVLNMLGTSGLNLGNRQGMVLSGL